ncbi:MAG: ribosomal protection-like ABC-F family protein [Marvinbryantia sp.]|uniref:ribosomal protection-like ABC-F family protein n=1 Tax=Marvinbryantia sp. TaxID=2496532 RepID=UPI0025E582B6|nr:ABC-F family ATP-binding cassette domain-containing protein [uncultured Marvinbryantia sp.]
MILTCSHISKAFGTNEILKDVSFHIEEREKAAIVGINGAGKSTLLKIIMKDLSADEGEAVFAKGTSIGYLAQHDAVSSSNTIYEELLETRRDVIALEERIRALEQEMKHLDGDRLNEALETYNRLSTEFENKNGYAYQSEIIGILKGLGFSEEEFSKNIDTLSGGQKTRVALGKLLLQKPDIIFLDEPTNHLDMNSIAWLEVYLQNYPGAVVIVAHDRYFLNKVVTKIIELDNGHSCVFSGNYSAYAEKRAQMREAQMKAYLNQQQEIKHQEEVITKLRSFNREKSIKRAESRVKMLDKIERLEKPSEVASEMKIRLEPRITSGNDVLKVEGLAKSFGSLSLFSDLNFEIKRGEKVAIIGDNGTGKTTLLKILNGVCEPDAGSFSLGSKVHIGYYDQEHHVLHMEKTLFEEISDAYPALTNTQIRNVLASFLFTGDDVFKRISDLSGGERGRVSLAKLMLSEANFLILDEPTNHLDITSKEILENALNQYTGTVLYVSHDRYFINKTASRILELTGNTLVNYIGNYDYYLTKKEELTRIYAPQAAEKTSTGLFGNAIASPAVTGESDVKRDWKQQKEEQARERKRQNDLKKTEEQIQALETRDGELDEMLAQPEVYSDAARCMELNKEKYEISQKLEELYELWETLM